MTIRKKGKNGEKNGLTPDTVFIPPKARVMIEKVSPEIDGGLFPVKRVVREQVVIRANIFTDGHDSVTAAVLFRRGTEGDWNEARMKPLGNDSWAGSFTINEKTDYFYTLRASLDRFGSWRNDIKKKFDAGQDVKVDLQVGLQIIQNAYEMAKEAEKRSIGEYIEKLKEDRDMAYCMGVVLSDGLYELMLGTIDPDDAVYYGKELKVSVEREKALFSSWYEFFPRSWSMKPGEHGTFKEAERLLPEIARMGFDVVYLPPIHPIGKTNRKGKNNATSCKKNEPGCPWAIGSVDGGHKAVHPELGTIEDLSHFIEKAGSLGMEVALDLAYQCSPDHPYVKQHPEWFTWRPDGSVQFAENPPKKYEDVLPINFETENRMELWEELKSIVVFWIEKGITIFRVDNPHTKPFLFWDWLISGIRKDWPDIIFLAEAFTRPHVMYRLAKSGFSQSYTYFTWRISKKDFTDYMTELTRKEAAEIFRPNFWPNTPDILPEHLQYGGRPMFLIRAVLAATLSSNFGIYGPAFELCVSDPLPGREEYIDSEKFEIKKWDWDAEGNLKDFLARLNTIRKENPALRMTRNIRFCEISNDNMLCYYKATGDFSNIILVIVNLDPYHTQSGFLRLPFSVMGLDPEKPLLGHDLLSADRYVWQGEQIYIELDPNSVPAHVIRLKRHTKREQDFDYFM